MIFIGQVHCSQSAIGMSMDQSFRLLILDVWLCCRSLRRMAVAVLPARTLLVSTFFVALIWTTSGQDPPSTTLNPDPQPSPTPIPSDQPTPPADQPSTTPSTIS